MTTRSRNQEPGLDVKDACMIGKIVKILEVVMDVMIHNILSYQFQSQLE
jgi:hypothetical protein